MRQWVLKITEYADRLLEDLDDLDWPDSVKEMQRNWIGKSEGAEIDFTIDGHKKQVTVFTTRPDTIFGATYLVLAPEHPFVADITTAVHKEAVDAYISQVQTKSDLERTDLAKEKTGVFTGAFAVNPISGDRLPIWIADYVLTEQVRSWLSQDTMSATTNSRSSSTYRSLKSSRVEMSTKQPTRERENTSTRICLMDLGNKKQSRR